MYEFDHPNVLKLIGVCLDGGPAPFIIMPFMAHGSLLSYLRKERKELLLEPSTSLDETEVVRGLKYFSDNVIIAQCHNYYYCRNLLSRDCWISVFRLPREWNTLLARDSFIETLQPGTACKSQWLRNWK